MYSSRLSITITFVLLSLCTVAQAVTIAVTSTADVLDPTDGVCTLREAIRTTHGDAGDCVTPPSANIKPHKIILPAGTYTLTIPGIDELDSLTGDLNIPRYASVRIIGAGRDVTIIDGNGLDRVFSFFPDAVVEVKAITITGGYSPNSIPWGGGGVWATGGHTTLRDCAIEGNSGHYPYGGGILADGRFHITIVNCLIRNNEGYSGGGIKCANDECRIIDSTIEGNTAGGDGGGISHEADYFVLMNSAVINNTAVSGGGIYAYDDINIVNSTISGNSANGAGGISLSSGGSWPDNHTILNSTITGNSALWGGGGVRTGGIVELLNSIVAGNSPDDCDDELGPDSGGYNLFGRNGGCYDYWSTTDIVIVEQSDVMTDVLDPLQDNGGPTPTHALLPGSPAVDAADPAGCVDENGDPLVVDQRGEPRPVDGDGNGTAICDIGSYEATTSNFPPTAIAASDAPVECSSFSGGLVTLDGSLSSDPNSTPGTNDDIELFEWFEDFGLPGEVLLGVGEILPLTLTVGSHEITLRVTDQAGLFDTDTIDVAVTDTTPPEISVFLDPDILWPPNHRMVTITAEANASDICSAPTVVLQSISSDEPDDAPGGGDGHTADDIQGADIGTADFGFLLRAERAAGGDGRTYTVTYSATDSAGNETEGSAEVFVPHHINPRGALDRASKQSEGPEGLSISGNPETEETPRPRGVTRGRASRRLRERAE